MKKVTVGVVLFGTKYLDKSLPSLVNQDYPNIEYIFRDQEDGKWTAAAFIEEKLPEVAKKAQIIKGDNLWHSGGHNAIINQMEGDFYLCASNDMLYPKDLVPKMVAALVHNPKFSFAACKLKQWDFENSDNQSQGRTNKIDSLGIGITEYHHFYDIAQGKEDGGQYNDLKEVWGSSGALTLLSKKALNSIKYEGEYFDSLMHYKNDVDLSYRLRWAGNHCLLVQNTAAYHDRQSSQKQPFWARKSSFLGEKILMFKNFSEKFPLRIRIQTALYHFLKTFYLVLRWPPLFLQQIKFFRLRPELKKKRDRMARNISPEEIFSPGRFE